jgi:UDP-N-acetylmuramoyl-tripeptide--D-alanyl-D-alanine ligase
MLQESRGEHVLDSVAVAERGGGQAVPGLSPATGVSFHSQRVRPGDAFFALPGAAQHGLTFADAALAAGAAYIVSDKPHPQGVTVSDPAGLLLDLGADARRQLQGVIVGVTGSAGKTSCKALLAAALGATATPGNFNTPLALAQMLLETALAGRSGADARLVLELGIDHPGEMDTLLRLVQPTHAVLTLIAPSHLAGLETVAGVAREKLKLIDAAEHAFVSVQAATFLNATQRRKVTTYGLGSGDVGGTLTEITPTGQTLSALGARVRLPFVGAALAENALAAIAVAAHLGDDVNAAVSRLEGVTLEPGRLQVHHLGALTLLDDSYNSNPASAAAALETLQHFPPPHSAVLGDMLELGPESARYHRELGARTTALERVVAVGPEMRALVDANPNAAHFETFDLDVLKPHLPERGTLLVKGSRGLRLERLVQELLTSALSDGAEVTRTEVSA